MKKPGIIIIDDNVKFAKLLQTVLRLKGYEEIQIYDHSCDLQNLKVGMEDIGIVSCRNSDRKTFETIRFLKKRHGLKLIACASVQHNIPDEIAEIGIDGIITKTDSEPDKIIQTVEQVIEKKILDFK